MAIKHFGSASKIVDFLLLIYIISIFVFADRPETVLISRVIFIFLAAFLFMQIIKTNKLRIGSHIMAYTGFVLWNALGLYWAIDPQMATDKLFTLLQLLVMMSLVFNHLDTDEKVHRILKMITVSSLTMYLAIYLFEGKAVFIQILTTGDNIRLGAEVNQENTMGLIASISTIISYYYLFFEKKKIYLLTTIISFIFAMLSGSRKSVLMISVALFSLYIFGKYKHKYWKILTGALVLIGTVYVIVSSPMFAVILKRTDTFLALITGEGKIDQSTQLRSLMIIGGWREFLLRPLNGYGLAGTNYICQKYTGMFTYLHCNYIELLVASGIVGFSIYYSFYITFLIKLFKLRSNSIALLLFSLMFAITVSDFTEVTYFSKLIQIIFVIIGSYLANENKKAKLLKEKPN